MVSVPKEHLNVRHIIHDSFSFWIRIDACHTVHGSVTCLKTKEILKHVPKKLYKKLALLSKEKKKPFIEYRSIGFSIFLSSASSCNSIFSACWELDFWNSYKFQQAAAWSHQSLLWMENVLQSTSTVLSLSLLLSSQAEWLSPCVFNTKFIGPPFLALYTRGHQS